jgi:hypothetical protein
VLFPSDSSCTTLPSTQARSAQHSAPSWLGRAKHSLHLFGNHFCPVRCNLPTSCGELFGFLQSSWCVLLALCGLQFHSVQGWQGHVAQAESMFMN